jgi:hypothetical protein
LLLKAIFLTAAFVCYAAVVWTRVLTADEQQLALRRLKARRP